VFVEEEEEGAESFYQIISYSFFISIRSLLLIISRLLIIFLILTLSSLSFFIIRRVRIRLRVRLELELGLALELALDLSEPWLAKFLILFVEQNGDRVGDRSNSAKRAFFLNQLLVSFLLMELLKIRRLLHRFLFPVNYLSHSQCWNYNSIKRNETRS
jgi:hypothetical protein